MVSKSVYVCSCCRKEMSSMDELIFIDGKPVCVSCDKPINYAKKSFCDDNQTTLEGVVICVVYLNVGIKRLCVFIIMIMFCVSLVLISIHLKS